MMRGRDEDPERGSPSSESPLRQALGGKTPSSSSSSSSTPILSASLNAPPMLNERSGLDLSRLGFTRSRDPDEEEDTARKNGLYKHLISQLQSGPPKRLKPSLSSRFQCPVCRKRFQRHIALNAHFQSEHIGEDSLSKEKSCKICQTRLSACDPSTIRLHLLSAHRIDLENPAACLISDDVGSSANVGSTTHPGSKYSVLRASLSSSPDDESSVGSSSSSSSSSSISSASSERLFLHEEPISDAKHHQKDLIGNNHNHNNNSNNGGSLKKRRKPSRPSGEVSSAGTNPPWQCIHCSIIFPNQTLYFLHKGFHGEVSDPFRCNGCGMACSDMYDFNTHLMSDPHH